MSKLPSIVSNVPKDVRQFLDRVRDIVNGGGGPDRLISYRDLVDAGIAAYGPNGVLLPGTGTQGACQNPPPPVNLSTAGALASVLLTWDQPLYRCHAYTEIFAGETDVVGDAVLIGQTTGTVFTHAIGGAASRYYWVRFVSTQGVVGPFNATNGTLGETGQDPAYLLGLLNGQITESQLYQDLNTRIDQIDTSAVIDGQTVAGGIIAKYQTDILGAGGVVERLTAIDTPDTGALALEAAARALGDASEAQARIDGIQAEASARIADVNANATTALNALTAINTTRDELLAGVTQATFELTQYVDAGVSAEANARLALKAQLEADDDVLTAAVLSEQNARVEGDAAEASARQGLTAQILGADGTAQTSGLLWQESQARASQDAALSQQITLLSAGAGETFDFNTIWYFDSGVENWTSNGGTPTATLGWLRPFNHATDPYVTSPTISEDGSKYTQVRVRVRKTGTPTWGGNLWWYNGAWSSIAIDEPSFDAVGISVVTVNPAWSGTITQIRLDLSTAQDASNYFEIDWVAIGRPAPGASTASVFELSHATVDMANSTSLAYKMTALTAKVDDPVSGNTALALAVSNTYTKAQADSALAGREAAIAARYGTTANKIFRQDAAPVQGTTNLTTQTGTVAVSNIANGDLWIDTNDGNKQYVWETGGWVERQNTSLFGTAAFTSATEDYLANGEGAFVTQIQDTVAAVNDPETGNAAAIATANEALEATATLEETLVRESKQLYAAQGGYAENDLRNAVANHENAGKIRGAMATIIQDAWVNTQEGLEAEAGRREELAAVVDSNQAYIIENYYTKATTDESIAEVNRYIEAKTDEATAFILEEAKARATETEALASQIDTLSAEVDDARSMVVTEAQARATQGEATASQIDLLYTNTEASNALVLNQLESYAGATSALATATELLSATVQGNNAYALENTKAQADTTSALVENVNILSAAVGDNNALSLNRTVVQADATSALAREIAFLSATVGSNTASAFEQTSTQASTNSAVAEQINSLSATVAGANAMLGTYSVAMADAVSAQARDLYTLQTKFDDNVASVTRLTQAMSSSIASFAEDRTQVYSLMDGFATTVETTSQSIDGIKGQYTVKIDNNGYVSGFGLSSDLVDGGTPTSAMIVNVDNFAVAFPTAVANPARTNNTAYLLGARVATGKTGVFAQSIQAGTSGGSVPATWANPTVGTQATDGSVVWQYMSTMPLVVTKGGAFGGVNFNAGTYIDGAYIVNATIGGAKIRQADIDIANITGELTANRISAGTIGADNIYLGDQVSGMVRLDASTKSMTFNDGTQNRVVLDTNGISIFDANGGTVLTSGGEFSSLIANMGSGVNLITPAYTTFGDTAPLMSKTNCTVDIAVGEGYFGGNALQATASVSGGYFFLSKNTDISLYPEQGFLVRPAKYILSFWAKTVSSGTTVDVRSNYRTNLDSASTGAVDHVVTSTWTRLSRVVDLSLKTGTDANGVPLRNVTMRFSLMTAAVSVYFDGFMLEEQNGNVSTPSTYAGSVLRGLINESNASTYIADAAITNAKIGSHIASTDFDGDIEADGDLGVSSDTGTQGWIINKNGLAVLNNAIVRGTVYASSGEFSGVLKAATGSFEGTVNYGSMVGGTISGTTISGGFIEGTIISTSLQLRETQATQPSDPALKYYTRFSSKSYGGSAPLAFWYRDGKDSALYHYQGWSENLIPYAYNATPTGTAYIDRYYGSSVTFTFSGSFVIGGRGGNEQTAIIKLQNASTGADISTIFNADFRSYPAGALVTQNGVSIQTIVSGDGLTYTTTISGSYQFTWSGTTKNYPLRIYVYFDTWRGSYNLGPTVGSFTVTTVNHNLV